MKSSDIADSPRVKSKAIILFFGGNIGPAPLLDYAYFYEVEGPPDMVEVYFTQEVVGTPNRLAFNVYTAGESVVPTIATRTIYGSVILQFDAVISRHDPSTLNIINSAGLSYNGAPLVAPASFTPISIP